ncbi:MAG TPA: FtsW/RodA/SpoVE family cell cycle protein [Tepidisphaeraceae bacterium]|jgi:cell division protein FtsW (lipid II flippase)
MFKSIWQQLAIASNWPVLAAVAVLCFLGSCSIWHYPRADGVKQLIFVGIATGCLLLMQGINYQKVGRFAWVFYIFSLLLLVYTIVPFTHVAQNSQALFRVPYRGGAYAWINLGPMSLQPAELTKIAFILVLARYLRFRSNYRTLGGLLAPFGLALVPIALILKQPDLGTALTFIPVLFAMLFIAGARMLHLVSIVVLGIVVAPLLWFSGQHVTKPATENASADVCSVCPSVPVLRHLPQFVKHYQRERVYAMFSDDKETRRESGFQQQLALTAIGSGGFTGKGMGEFTVGRFVPEAHNDMVFSLICEQFGFLGAAAVLGAYAVLFAAGIEIAAHTREPFGRLVAPGIVALLGGQAFLNLMVCMKLMPVTGVTLPFVSYGGSSLVASFMATGLLLNIGQNRPFVVARSAFDY